MNKDYSLKMLILSPFSARFFIVFLIFFPFFLHFFLGNESWEETIRINIFIGDFDFPFYFEINQIDAKNENFSFFFSFVLLLFFIYNYILLPSFSALIHFSFRLNYKRCMVSEKSVDGVLNIVSTASHVARC